MLCVFCQGEEIYHLNGRKRAYKPSKDVASFICSDCFQMFLQMPQDKLAEAYHLAIEKGYLDKASWVESFIDDETEDFDDPKTPKVRRSIVREKVMRVAGLANHQKRS